ncbi:MAG: hypothetical protein WBN07_03785 [Woeseiaceae bacterium]
MSLIQELKRRNVIRVGVLYLVAAWLLLQITDVLSSLLPVPESAGPLVILLLVLGFFPVLIFAWVYEMTPEGLKREAEIDRSQSVTQHTGTKINTLIIVLLVLAIGGLIADRLIPEAAVTTAPTEASSQVGDSEIAKDGLPSLSGDEVPGENASIAVLPFADLSPEGDQEFFSDGIAEEILNVLVRIENLKVASRTSSFGFKGQGVLGIPAIAEKLGVRHVLEGSVRKAGETVRITAQLIDARTDAHLWSDTYDRTLTTENIFAIQDEIAQAIVDQLGLIVGDQGERPAPRKTVTANLDAYSMYLEAKGIFHRRSHDNVPDMVALLERAVELDPDFAEAWASLASAYSIVPGWNLGTPDEYLPRALQAADRASALNDRLSLPYAIRGSIASDRNDQIGALEHLAEAVEREPNSLHLHYVRGAVLLELGFFDRAEDDFRQCLRIDPAYEICRRFLSFMLLFQGNEAEAATLFEIGMLRGQRSWRNTFLGYYAAIDNQSALANLIAELIPEKVWRREPLFRLLTDTSYRFETYMADVHSGALAATGEPDSNLFLGQENFEPPFPGGFFWNPYSVDRLRPDALNGRGDELRKMWMTRRGVVDYWRQKGFPPQCKPAGDDDFECARP